MSGTDGLSNHIRKYLLDKTNYTCEIPGCGCNFINPYTGLSILQIHHIDGDATNNKVAKSSGFYVLIIML